MEKIIKVTRDEVAALGIKPDPHSVTLTDDGEWWVLDVDGVWVSFLCIRPRLNEMHVREVFTLWDYRRRGYLQKLASYVCNEIYGEYQISIHCLIKSRDCFKKLGFAEFSFRHFPYGDQWWLRRPGRKLTDVEKEEFGK